jgi:tRNA(Ser,Leu) C12 N-acetylase TAN1
MEALYLVKIGEILLKLGNRREFEERLKTQIKRRLAGIPHRVEIYPGRFFVRVDEERAAEAEFVLSRTPGVNGYARAIKTEKTVEAVIEAALKVAAGRVAAGKRSFKAESRRSDKSFPLGSFELSAEIGEKVLEAFIILSSRSTPSCASEPTSSPIPSPVCAAFPSAPEGRASSSFPAASTRPWQDTSWRAADSPSRPSISTPIPIRRWKPATRYAASPASSPPIPGV